MTTSQEEPMSVDFQPDPRTTEERELDEKFSALLAQHKVLNNLRQQVKSLQDLSSKSVVDIVKNCARNNADFNPLDGLPATIITIVKDAMGDLDNMNFDVIKFLITGRTQELSVNFSEASVSEICDWRPWTQKEVDSFVETMNNCENQLTKLSISLDGDSVCPSLTQIYYIISHQSNLCELILSACEITDETLAIIGCTCHNLNVLDIDDNNEVTDTGLLYLCASAEPHGKCTKITDLNIDETLTTDAGLTIILLNLPKLETIYCGHLNINKVINKLCENNSPIKLPKFKKLNLNCRMANYIQLFPKLLKMFPNIVEIEIETQCIDIKQLLQFKHIEILSIIINKRNTDFSALPSVILHFKDTLTSIDITNKIKSNIVNIDLSVFAQCPFLDYLEVRNCHISQETEHTLLPTSFTKLTDVGLYIKPNDCNNRTDSIPEHILMKMLQSNVLRFFSVQCKISEDVLRSIIDEVAVNPGVFSEIINMHLMDKYSLETLIKFLCIIPDHHDWNVDIMYSEQVFNNADMEKLNSFARRNNIKADIRKLSRT